MWHPHEVGKDNKNVSEIESRLPMGKAALNNKKTFHQQIGLNFMEETGKVLHLAYNII